MVRVTRRDFLKYCAVSAGALGLSASTLMRLESVLAKTFDRTSTGAPPVVWLAGAACTGCTMSLLNEVFYTTIDDVLLNKIDLKFIDTLNAAAGYANGIGSGIANSIDAAKAVYDSGLPFVLVVEGAVQEATPPNGSAGDYCRIGNLTGTGPETMLENVKLFAAKATAILAVGACSSFGGIPGAKGNVTGAKGVAFTGTTLGGAVIGTGDDGVQAISVKADGSGYNTGDTPQTPSVFFDQGTAKEVNETSSVSVDVKLGVTSIDITTNPVFTLRPNVEIISTPPQSGLQATAMAIINETDSAYYDPAQPIGALLSIAVTYKGSGYSTASLVTIKVTDISTDPPTDVTGSVTYSVTVSGYIAGVTVNTPPITGYSAAPAVSISAPATPGTQAELAAVMAIGGGVDVVKFRTGDAQKLINISGCPPHPDWIVGTIAYILDYLPAVLTGNATVQDMIPALDRYYRPVDFGYATYQCNAGPCPWRYNNANNVGTTSRSIEAYEYNRRYPQGDSRLLGIHKYELKDLGCLGILGCKGRKTKADCSARRWNADGAEQYGVNWCVGSRGGCHGCTEPTFPDKVGKFFTFA